MGLDGGTLATRTDLLRRASWRLANHDGGSHRSTRGGQLSDPRAALAVAERRDRNEDVADGFDTCAVSGTRFPFTPEHGAIVACALGRLYLRDAIVEYLTKSGQFADGLGDTARLHKNAGILRGCATCLR